MNLKTVSTLIIEILKIILPATFLIPLGVKEAYDILLSEAGVFIEIAKYLMILMIIIRTVYKIKH